MDKTYKSIKIGAAEYRDLRAYAEKQGLVLQRVLTAAIHEFLTRQHEIIKPYTDFRGTEALKDTK